MDHPFNPICKEWLRKIDIAKKKKHEEFGQYAEEASKFYDGPHDWMWKDEYASGMNGFLDSDGSSHLPTFRMTVNKPFEAVALFGPALMHKYPQVLVTPSTPPVMPPQLLGLDPVQGEEVYEQYLQSEEQTKLARTSVAGLKEHYLNWLQVESDKKSHARRAITEAIVKGLGILWVDIHTPKGSKIRYPRSSFVSCNDIQKDPDAVYNSDVTWVARSCCHPVNRVAEKYGLQESQLRGHLQSYASQATPKGRKDRRSGKSAAASSTYDLVEYWEIYSKNGFGQKLKTTPSKGKPAYPPILDEAGDFCYIVVAPGIPFPLNFPSEALAEDPEEQFQRCQWPVPYWTDEGCGNGWPFAELHFYEKMNSVWPISLIKPAIGELRFINWCMSFLADKVAASSTTYVAKAKAAGVEIQNQLQQGLAPYTTMEISDLLGKNIQDVVSFLQAPSFSIDIWNMVASVQDNIDRRTGLTELIYGLSGQQMRSATEADVRESHTSIRPDDMAERTEDFYSQTAMKECEAAVWALNGDDVRGVLGDAGAMVFEEYIQTQDFETTVRDFAYRLEAGSARKPNKNTRMRNINEWGARALPVIQQFAMQGLTGPWNAYMAEVAKAMDFDATPFLIELPPPEEQPDEEQEEHDVEMGREEEKHEQELDHKEELHTLAMRIKRDEGRVKLSAGNGSGVR